MHSSRKLQLEQATLMLWLLMGTTVALRALGVAVASGLARVLDAGSNMCDYSW
jgi:hypothetical protein